MTLEEMEKATRDTPKGTTLTVTHMAIVQDEESGHVSRIPLTLHMGSHSIDPDFHLGAVGGE